MKEASFEDKSRQDPKTDEISFVIFKFSHLFPFLLPIFCSFLNLSLLPDERISFMRVLLILMVIASLSLFTPRAFADTSCQAIYGGGQTCTTSAISIEKDVVNPATDNDVHDLGVNDPAFHPGDTITFHITIQNTGSSNISSLTVKDIFPKGISFINGPGNFDPASNTLTFQVGGLATNQAQTFTIQATANPISGTQISCMVNQAVVTTSDNASSQDSSQFCIQPAGVVSVTPTALATPQPIQTPATGPSALLWGMLVPVGIGGYFLQKQARRKDI